MPILANDVKRYLLVLQRRVCFTGHQGKIIKSFIIEYELVCQKLGSNKSKDVFIIYDILDLMETVFVLCFFLTSKIVSVEGQFDQGACNGTEIVLILIQIESNPSDQYLTRMNI